VQHDSIFTQEKHYQYKHGLTCEHNHPLKRTATPLMEDVG